MTNNERLSSNLETDYDYSNLSESPFFADFDPNIQVNSIGLSIPRPRRPITRPEFTREMIEYLKKLTVPSEPAQSI